VTVHNLQPETATLLRGIFHRHEISWPDEIGLFGRLSEEISLQEVTSQGMAPLLFRILAKKTGDWPSGLLAGLRETALRQVAFELVLEVDLRRLLVAFAEIGVKPLLLKGTPLSHTLYPELGLRPRCDTDLLIPESARKKTAALMKRSGYHALHEANADYISSQMSYSKKIQGFFCSYDIHWQVSNCNRQFSRDFTDGRLFEDAVAIPSLGQNARTLNRVDALLFSCFHRAGHFAHSGDRLIWLYDIHLLCQTLTKRKSKNFFDKAKQLEIVTVCADAITVAQSWFDTVLSQPLESLLKEKAENEFSGILLESGRLGGIKQHAFLELKGMSSWRERFYFLFQNAFPPAEYMIWRYSPKNKAALPWLYVKRFAEGVYIFSRK